jgi:AraC family transcriptional regulator
MKMIISHMVYDRCIIVTEAILNKLGVQNYEVSLGHIKFKDQVSNEILTNLREELQKVGFEIVEDKHQQLIESIIATIIKYLEFLNEGTTLKMSQYISDNVYYEYS